MKEKSYFGELLKTKKKQILQSKSLSNFIELTNGIFPRSVATGLYGKSWNEITKTFNNTPSTKSMLVNLLNKSSKAVRDKVVLYHYPKTEGNMADQLNFAMKRLLKNEEGNSVYTAIYNADSIISKDFPSLIRNYIAVNKNALVIQQSALFLSNYNLMGNYVSSAFLRAVALLQSRWTLAHEIPRIFKQLKSSLEGAHIVGHGLIINLRVMEKVGFFPANFVNEDLPLGYILKLHGYKIYPFPQLENAQSPTSVKSMFTQYTTWFYGVFHYPSYIRYALWNFRDKQFIALIWGVKYFVRSLLWLFLSFAWIYIFIYPLFVHNPYLFAFSTLTFIMYSVLCFYLIESFLNKNGDKIFGKNVYIPIKISSLTYLMSFFGYITHSYGPILATYNTFKLILFGKTIKKMKTER